MNQFIKIACIALLCWCTASVFGQVKVINQKGTVVLLDTSKWVLNGSNIFNKNTGNLGIGTTNPLAKLHTNGSIRFEALGTNTVNTNILTTNGIGEVTTRSFANLLEGSALTSLNGLTQSLQTFATGTSGTDFNISSSSTTHTFNIPTASASSRGLLSTTDWSTFNNKLGNSLTNGNIFVGNGSNVATSVTMSGDATLASTGALTISNNAITSAKLANNAVTIAKLPSGATATSFLRGDGTWVVPTGTTYAGSTSIVLNGSSFERAALTGDVTAALNSNATTIANNAVTSAKILDNTIATADIANSAVTYAKMQNASASRLLGNPTGASAAPSEISLGSGLSFSGSTLNTVNNGTVTNVTGTSPISVSTGTTTPVVSISTANATTSGALSNTDWTTFNNKIGAISGTAPITASTTSGTTTLGINRNNIVSGTSSNTATAALTLDGGATNAVVGGANATLTVNNTAPLWNANQLQGRNVVSTAPTNGQVLRFNGTDWAPATESAASNWLITGNANTSNANFLGTTNDVEMSIRSNNTTMFQVGRRQTLALWDNSNTGIFPYNQQNASVAYIRGTGGNSSLQFEASGASFYKPIFFTDSDGNFKMRGSSAGTDFFELGSAGASNLGSLEFIIGDDGNEPMSFKKYNYRNGGSYKEILRIQGSADDVEANSLPRVGINVNETTPTSTFQNNGSFSLPINTATAGNFTVTELMYTIIIPSGVNAIISLPSAAGITGRIYVVKNNSGGNRTISSYRDLSNNASTTVANNSAITLQSDGTNWQRIQ